MSGLQFVEWSCGCKGFRFSKECVFQVVDCTGYHHDDMMSLADPAWLEDEPGVEKSFKVLSEEETIAQFQKIVKFSEKAAALDGLFSALRVAQSV